MKKLTTAEFCERAKKVHGDRYDYSKAEYINSHTKLIIICSQHGEFQQTPNGHLCGRGCMECAAIQRPIKKRLTTEDFLVRAHAAHGDKYDYSRVIYTGAKDTVEVVCPKHGGFMQRVEDHWQGKGCVTCGRDKSGAARRLTTPEFISKASQVHQNKYDYSRAIYSGWEEKVWIRCQSHGLFQQRGGDHLSGKGCPKCGREFVEASRRSTKEEFLDKAIEVHGDLYDYSLVEYVNSDTDVTIICKDHGPFKQRPANHLNGKGCIKCAGKELKTTKDFVDQAKIIHANKYDYSLVDYQGASKHVVIICPEHGKFKQSPTNHLQGKGCRQCTWGGFDSSKPGLLYYLKISVDGINYYKIGITNKSVVARYKKADLDKIEIIKEWYFESGQAAFDQEFSTLREYKEYIYDGPDVIASGNTEVFTRDVLGLDPEHKQAS